MASMREWRRFGHGVCGPRAVCSLVVLCVAGCSSLAAGESDAAEAVLAVGPLGPGTLDVGRIGQNRAGSRHAEWLRELQATAGSVSSSGVAADAAGNAFVTGYTLAEFDGTPHASSDAFVAKYSPRGKLLWTRQLASADSDASAGVSLDGAGNVFIAGDTTGALDGAASGFGDGFVAKYSPAGELEWTRQLGTPEPDAALGVSTDADGNVFSAGFTRGSLVGSRSDIDMDAWVAKYSSAGQLLWTRQLSSSRGDDDVAAGVSTDAQGNVLIAGHSFGPLEGESHGSADAFVAKLSADGELLWIRQQGGAGYDAAEALSTDGDGNVYVSGQMGGTFVGGPGVVLPGNPYVAKYSPAGDLLWERQLEDAASGSASRISVEPGGSAFIAGYTSGAWGGPNRGLYDSFVAQLSAEGDVLWALQLGFTELDQATGVAADGAGHFFLSRDAQNASADGSDRAFLLRAVVPTPRPVDGDGN